MSEPEKKVREDRIALGFLRKQEGQAVDLHELQAAYAAHHKIIKRSRRSRK